MTRDTQEPPEIEPTNIQVMDMELYETMYRELEQVLLRYRLPPYMNIAALEYLKAAVIRSQQDGAISDGKS